MKVLKETPLRPSEVTERVDRDLEAVCLKCIERDANDQYSSAAALADDLENWLAAKPLRVRPPSPALLQSWFVHNSVRWVLLSWWARHPDARCALINLRYRSAGLAGFFI